jgi:hypothetical protein
MSEALQFGPYDVPPIPLSDARTMRLVFESGKPFLVISTDDGWRKYRINNDQLWGLFQDMAPKLRGR